MPLAPVHGDFRNGNLMVGEDGLRAVLDWELAHWGDPMEDLGWLCVNSWRFGKLELPVGGFGTREQLFEGYAEGGGVVDAARVHYWEVFGTLKWGVICQSMAHAYLTGAERNVERAAIGRRASEAEIDLLMLLAPPARKAA
jgi:aminoglycoside phosphotransferase (APT) family kinase protein